MKRPTRIGLVLVAALVLVAVGAFIARASVPDTSGAITACLDANHSMRVIDTASESCGTGETTLSWLAFGGSVLADHTNAAQSISGGATVASISVPPGKYVLSGKTWIDNSGGGTPGFAQCGLTGSDFTENARGDVRQFDRLIAKGRGGRDVLAAVAPCRRR